MTSVAQAITALTGRLTEAGRDEARLKAELLLAHVLGVGRLAVLTEPGRQLTDEQQAHLEVLARRLLAGEPLQYVLGEAWFWGRCFKADPRGLIPRPETEELVQRVLDDTDLWLRARPAVADVGVGTGCIALTLAAERPAADVLGIDIQAAALALAQENEARLGLAGRVTWRQGDLLEGVAAASLDAVVSNPPYIAGPVIATLAVEVRDHEPRSALDGGPDGLDLVRRLAAQAMLALRPGGKLWMEIGDEQGDAARRILVSSGFADVLTRRDLAGHDRLVEGCRR